MNEIRGIQGNRLRAAERYQSAAKIETQEESTPVKGTDLPARAAAVMDIKQLAGRFSQTEAKWQTARQALVVNEAALTEVRDGLDRMKDLAQAAAGEEQPDREALQDELSRLRQELMRILGGAPDGASLLSAERSTIYELPTWLLWGMANSPDPEQLLEALGLDKSASGSEIKSALSKLPLEDPAAGYLAAVYLGAVIAGGGTDQLEASQAAQGLLRLLEAMQGGKTPDQAVSELTKGLFESIADFEQQFLNGAAPGMEPLFSGMLSMSFSLPDLMDLLANGSMDEAGLLMLLLTALESADSLLLSAGEGAEPAPEAGSPAPAAAQESQEMGGVTVQEQDSSEAAYAKAGNAVTAGGDKEAVLLSREGQAPELVLTGQGEAVLKETDTPRVTVDSRQARLSTQGETALKELNLKGKAILTLAGTGLTTIGSLKGGPDNTLRLKEGAFLLERQAEALPVKIVIDGAVILQASKESHVFNLQGEELEPYDLPWKDMFPEWSSVESIVIDGRHAQVLLTRNAQPDLARLWLLKGDPSQGFPAHLIALEGRGSAGELRTRYVYLQWSRRYGGFRPVSMFPNPFTVTGGKEGTDWRYEEESRTLRVLTSQVSGLAGGMGTDAAPFSGRLALADGIGRVELLLDGVVCRVSSGRACSLGGGNSVTLLLKRGTESIFESGAGCAGISLGEGASLCIDQPHVPGQPDGSLTAIGGTASPGIGRDSGQGRALPVMVRGGRVRTVEGRKAAGGKTAPNSALAGLRVSAQALKLDAMDISTKEAARNAVKQLSAGRRWVSRLQEAYRAVYGKIEQGLNGLGSARQYAKAVRDEDEVSALMWDMCQELLQTQSGPYGQWKLEDMDRLLGAMERMISP